jgi:hypothetical protein
MSMLAAQNSVRPASSDAKVGSERRNAGIRFRMADLGCMERFLAIFGAIGRVT